MGVAARPQRGEAGAPEPRATPTLKASREQSPQGAQQTPVIRGGQGQQPHKMPREVRCDHRNKVSSGTWLLTSASDGSAEPSQPECARTWDYGQAVTGTRGFRAQVCTQTTQLMATSLKGSLVVITQGYKQTLRSLTETPGVPRLMKRGADARKAGRARDGTRTRQRSGDETTHVVSPLAPRGAH